MAKTHGWGWTSQIKAVMALAEQAGLGIKGAMDLIDSAPAAAITRPE